MEHNHKLNKVNKQLTKEIKTLKQNGKERDDLYAGEREQFLKKISLLETKYAELKSQCNDVKQVNTSLKSELYGFIQKHEDGVYCDKKYDKVALADIKAETIMAREDIETNKKNLSEFKTKVLDKLNHLSQVTNSVSKQISQPRHSNGSKEDINTMNEKQQHSTPVEKHNGEYPDAISDNDTLNTHVAPSQNTRDLSKNRDNLKECLSQKEILIVGDSMLKLIKMKKFDYSNRSFVKTLRGAKIEDVHNFMTQVKHANPKNIKHIIFHIGTNNLRDDSPEQIYDKITSLIIETRKSFPNTKISLSCLIHRELKTGQEVFVQKINEVNRLIKGLSNDVNIIPNHNLNNPKFRSDGLHLNDHGTAILVKNFKSVIIAISNESNQIEYKENRRASDERQQHEPLQQNMHMAQQHPRQTVVWPPNFHSPYFFNPLHPYPMTFPSNANMPCFPYGQMNKI